MKTIASFLAACSVLFAQFTFPSGLGLTTWKGAPAPYVGPFDGFTASQGLWDINVRLLSSYTGDLITVRRSSDNATNSFTYVPATGKLDTNAITAWSGSDTVYITTVHDQSGGGRNFSQATEGLQPKLLNAGTFYSINGEPSMQKTATGVRLHAPVTGTITELNIITVGKSTDAMPVSGALMSAGDNTGSVGHSLVGPDIASAPSYEYWVYCLGVGLPIYTLGNSASYAYPHTFSMSVDSAATNMVFNIDTLVTANENGILSVPLTSLSWLDDRSSVSSDAAWASGSMALFSPIPADQTAVMRYYTNRFATTYIP